jgi:hypothetical protein
MMAKINAVKIRKIPARAERIQREEGCQPMLRVNITTASVVKPSAKGSPQKPAAAAAAQTRARLRTGPEFCGRAGEVNRLRAPK